MAQLAQKRKLLKKKKLSNIILNTVCLVIAGSGLFWVGVYFWR